MCGARKLGDGAKAAKVMMRSEGMCLQRTQKVVTRRITTMKTLKTLIAAAVLTSALAAQAVIIDLGITAGSPASQTHTLTRLNGQIDIYNAANNPDLPEALAAGSTDTVTPGGGTSIDLDITGWSYLSLKWGNDEQHYYIGDDSGVVTFNSTVFNENSPRRPALGLSGYSLFNPGTTTTVPDAGTSVMLLGAGLLGIGALRRRLAK